MNHGICRAESRTYLTWGQDSLQRPAMTYSAFDAPYRGCSAWARTRRTCWCVSGQNTKPKVCLESFVTGVWLWKWLMGRWALCVGGKRDMECKSIRRLEKCFKGAVCHFICLLQVWWSVRSTGNHYHKTHHAAFTDMLESYDRSSDWSTFSLETNRFKLISTADNSLIPILFPFFVPVDIEPSASVWDTSLPPQLVLLLPNPSFTPRMQ